jgi:hypothetical protein
VPVRSRRKVARQTRWPTSYHERSEEEDEEQGGYLEPAWA